MSVRARLALLAVLVLALATAGGPAAAQCAMCQTALTGSPEGRGMTVHLNHAILLMFFAPYLVVTTFLLIAFRHSLRLALAERLGRARALLPGLLAGRPTLRWR